MKLNDIQNISYDLPIQSGDGIRQLDDNYHFSQRLNDVNVIDYDISKQLPKYINIDNSDTTQGIEQDVKLISVAPNLQSNINKSFDWVEKELSKNKLQSKEQLVDFGSVTIGNRIDFDHMKHRQSKLYKTSEMYQDRYNMFKLY